MSDHGVEMPLPPLPGRVWHRTVDTGQNSAGDILEPEEQLRAKEYLDIPSFATQPDGMLRRPKCEVIFERALRSTIAGQIQRTAL
jgi:hypothetical protein